LEKPEAEDGESGEEDVGEEAAERDAESGWGAVPCVLWCEYMRHGGRAMGGMDGEISVLRMCSGVGFDVAAGQWRRWF
jgi:hypothetical protein